MKIIIDCKKFNKKVNVKTVEAFIGFLDDVGANLGVLITNKGYSKSAYNRVKNYPRDVRLDIVKYKIDIIDYENLNEHHFWETCEACANSKTPAWSEIYWESKPHLLEFEDICQYIQIGKCDRCGTNYMKCQGCDAIRDEYEIEHINCMCGLMFGAKPINIADGSDHLEVVIKGIEEGVSKNNFLKIEEIVNVNPNQLKMFDK